MLKLVLVTILFSAYWQYAVAVTIENQLAPVNHDCFQRVILEAMLPDDKVYRTIETNSVRACQDYCAAEGDRCQSFSIGISQGGNGTCQLAKTPATESGDRRPKGTIYDPSFDIYNRKKNCFPVNNNAIPTDGTAIPTAQVFPQQGLSEQPTAAVLTGTVGSTYTPNNVQPIPNTVIASSMNPPSTVPPYSEVPSTLTQEEEYTPKSPTYVPSTDEYTSTAESNRYPPRDRYPTGSSNGMTGMSGMSGIPGTNFYTSNDQANPTQSMSTMGNDMGSNVYHNSDRTDSYMHDQRPTQGSSMEPDCRPYCHRYPPNNQHNYQQIYPMYNYPMLYEHNYPMPNDRYPPPYENRVPTTVDSMAPGRPTSVYGSGTAAMFSGPNMRPTYQGGMPYNDRDSNLDRDRNRYGNSSTIGHPVRPTSPQDTQWSGRPNDRDFDRREGHDAPLPYDIRDRIDRDNRRTCFRRVLAGKRVAPRWVLRTLTCERVEDCQIECGSETRFVCEGFNYRLDPAGRGQGVCELIEVPLSQMDVYSSPSRRDENLIFHPDYDYYERDRNACRPSPCTNCGGGGYTGSGGFPTSGYNGGGGGGAGGGSGYRGGGHSSGGYDNNYDRGNSHSNSNNYSGSNGNETVGKPYPSQQTHDDYPPTTYRPNTYLPERRPPPSNSNPPGYGPPRYDSRPQPPPPPRDYDRFDRPSSNWVQRPLSVHDRFDYVRPIERPRPNYHEITIYEEHNDRYRPSSRPPSFNDRDRYDVRPLHPPPYLDRDHSRERGHEKPFIPYTINQDANYYGSRYGGAAPPPNDFGLKRDDKRPSDFNYFSLGGSKYNPNENSVLNYPGSGYDDRDRNYYSNLWTRRPGKDECSVKSSEGFRLHKAIVKVAFKAPTVTECERMCHAQNAFDCRTYSYRYSPHSRDNCLLCDRPMSHIDYYSDVQPDRDYDIYSMADEQKICGQQSPSAINRQNNAQCFFRAIENSRFFSSIVRDSLTVRSIGECEMECIKTSKFTCRAFTYRYGPKTLGSIIDNCQLSDWPVRDMDKERHLIQDNAFEVYERASYGHGCEIQPIADDKHKKFCYLGYGSPAKLLASAVKKVLTVPSELECKNECVRLRETTAFNCMSFSFGSQTKTFNCEMSDLDQTQLKLDVHYSHSNDRDYWLFAWNPFDLTCRDKVASVGGGSDRANNDRRMDIFRKPDGESTWSHFTVSGRPCRRGSACDKNLITGFYSCEVDGDEVGAWDYCCRSNYPCGYSQGFEYPWCFVGDGSDQWRKCSDKYYPVTTTPTGLDHNAITITSDQQVSAPITITISTQSPIDDDDDNSIHQRPPRPGGLDRENRHDRHDRQESPGVARLWPVTYLYTTGPPNSTDLNNYVDCNKEHC